MATRRLTLLVGDFLIFYLSLALALTVRQFTAVDLAFLKNHLVTFSQIFPFWLIVFYIVELYDIKRMMDLIALIGDTVGALGANLLVSVSLFYLFPEQLGIAPKTHLLLTLIFAHEAAFLWRHAFIRLYWPRSPLKVLFWGDSPLFKPMAEDLRRYPYLGYLPAENPGQGADLLVMDSERLDTPAGRAMLSSAIAREIPVSTHLDFYEEIYDKVPPSSAARPEWLLSHVLVKHKQVYPIVKRAIDIAGAAIGLLLFWPLVPLLALLAGGSPFYIQKRVGYHGREFLIWKFRTMLPDAEKRGPLDGGREKGALVTRLGAFLRRLRLDELPQLWNVLVGNMSLVGPRPEWTEEVKILEQKVPHYHLRHLVKPGITGWAQVKFRATASLEDSLEKLHYDLYYVKNLSLAMDIGILLKTIKRVFKRDYDFHVS